MFVFKLSNLFFLLAEGLSGFFEPAGQEFSSTLRLLLPRLQILADEEIT